MEAVERVLITPEAVKIVRQLRAEHGELMFHQSGGCCDGSQPMCFEKGEFKVGASDVYLGDIEECGFFMARDQFEYWQHTQLIIDIVPGRGASFSLEIPLGLRFITRSKMFTDDEIHNLKPIMSGEEYLELNQV
jgi:uncharacterized protein (DUF779 family)